LGLDGATEAHAGALTTTERRAASLRPAAALVQGVWKIHIHVALGLRDRIEAILKPREDQ